MSPAQPRALPPSPLTGEQLHLVESLTTGLPANGLWWLSGYAAGLAQAHDGQALTATPPAAAAPASAPGPRITVLFGSQTGNARRLAETLASRIAAAGPEVRLVDARDYPTRELAAETHLLVVISTQGDGDPPDDARGFMEYLEGRRAPKLGGLHFAVLGLGDSSYPKFCEIARRIDARLEALGGQRWLPLAEADLDIDSVAGPWQATALEAAGKLKTVEAAPAMASVTPLRPPPAPAPGASRDAPFAAEVLANQRITARNSDRDIRHIELSLEGSGLDYQPGDALGLWPENPPALVEDLLQSLGLDGDEAVSVENTTRPLRDWLSRRREITRLSRPVLAAHAERNGDPGLAALLAPEAREPLARLLSSHQPIDLFRRWPGDWDAAALVSTLRPLAPRLYSIASSRDHVGDEAHLTVAHVEYLSQGEPRWGAASHQLARLAEGEPVGVWIEPNPRFRLPQDPDRDIIMIGPGTGVAPFRGFVQARAAHGAGGRNWLFFGNPHARTDFLYQVEWQQALARGELHRLDLAFSRDGATPGQPDTARTYVQQRMLEQARELFAWLDNGAHLYVCGDATRMARDVHAALLQVARSVGGFDQETAEAWLSDLQQQGRYARDVY